MNCVKGERGNVVKKKEHVCMCEVYVCVCVCVRWGARGFGLPVAHLLHMGWQEPEG